MCVYRSNLKVMPKIFGYTLKRKIPDNLKPHVSYNKPHHNKFNYTPQSHATVTRHSHTLKVTRHTHTPQSHAALIRYTSHVSHTPQSHATFTRYNHTLYITIHATVKRYSHTLHTIRFASQRARHTITRHKPMPHATCYTVARCTQYTHTPHIQAPRRL